MSKLSFLQIIRLESERTQWEQRYLEESAMRQVAIDAASIPKDAKIAALEKNSAGMVYICLFSNSLSNRPCLKHCRVRENDSGGPVGQTKAVPRDAEHTGKN